MAIHFKNPLATFIHIPKTGGSSFQQWVYDNISNHDIKEKHATINQAQNIWNDLGFTFSFVRNPYSRLVSMFHFIGQRAEERNVRRSKGQKVKKGTTFENDSKIIELHSKGFDYWIDAYYKNTNEFMDTPNGNWSRRNTQASWLQGPVDLIIKIEEINEYFPIIQEKLNCNIPLPHVNKSNHKHYSEYFTKTTKKYVEKIFKEDLDKFGYEF